MNVENSILSRRDLLTFFTTGILLGTREKVAAQTVTLLSSKNNTRLRLGEVPEHLHWISTNLGGVLPPGAYCLAPHPMNTDCTGTLSRVLKNPHLQAWIQEIIPLEKWEFRDANFIIVLWGDEREAMGHENPFYSLIEEWSALALNSCQARKYLPAALRNCFLWNTPGMTLKYPVKDAHMTLESIFRNEIIERLISARCKKISPSWTVVKPATPYVQMSTYIIDSVFSAFMYPYDENKLEGLQKSYTKKPTIFMERLNTALRWWAKQYRRVLTSYLRDAEENHAYNSSLSDAEKETLRWCLTDQVRSYIPIPRDQIRWEECPFEAEIDGDTISTSFLIPSFLVKK